MARRIETYGTTKNGKHSISYRDVFMQQWAALGDCKFKITVEKLYKKRSTYTINEDGKEGRGENGYYHHIIVSTFIRGWFETHGVWITHAKAHEKLKDECNYKEWVNEATGEIKQVGQSTADLTTVEFEEFCERCRNWIFEWFNIVVKLPNEQGELEFTP